MTTFTPNTTLKAADLNQTFAAKSDGTHTHTTAAITDMSAAARALVQAASPKTALNLTKADVALGNVDNTADANKPVSTAQAAAIAAAKLLSGVGAPDPSLGAQSQFYLDTQSGNLYGPKGAAAWPATFFSLASAVAPTTTAAPVNTVAPTIAGTYQTGQALTASMGTWTGSPTPTYAYQWLRGPAPSGTVDPQAPPPPFDASTLTAIAGATSATYVTVSADISLRLYVRVTASSTAGVVAAYSLPTAAIAAPAGLAPVNTTVPIVTGAAQVGATLTGTNGAWSNTPAAYAYQWKRNGIAISGATSITYVPVAGDIGAALTLTVAASNASGSAAATSAPTAAVVADALTAPLLLAAPVITGTAQDTQTLASAQASWSETLTAPSNSDLPKITGTAALGQVLTASTGAWLANPAPTYAYIWNRDGAPISGATSSTYTLVSADVGAAITVTVTASNSAGAVSATSLATAAVVNSAAIPANLSVPTISGTAQDTMTLTASPGAWSNSPTSYAYQWKQAGTNISGATSSTYLVVTADVGSTITVAVIASNASGASSAAVSGATGTVATAPPQGSDFLWTTLAQSNGGNAATSFPASSPGTMVAIGQATALSDNGIINDLYFELKNDNGNASTSGSYFGFQEYPPVNDNPDPGSYTSLGFRWFVGNGDINIRSDRFDNSVDGNVPFPSPGNVARICFKLSTREIWIANETGSWNGSGTANPATGVGGLALPANTNPFFLKMRNDTGYADTDSITVKARTSTWKYAAPSGFTANRS